MVDERAARLVASAVVVLATIALLTRNVFVTLVLLAGFVLRTTLGPRASLLARAAKAVVARVSTPRLAPGPPKRFAQAIGTGFSALAFVLLLAGQPGLAQVVLAMLIGAAFLEAAFGFCLGCWIFTQLMRIGVIPDAVCQECSDLSLRLESQR